MPSVFLAKGFPGIQGPDRFTTFRMSTMHGLGSASPPVIVVSASGELLTASPDHLPFGQACQHQTYGILLWLEHDETGR
jgi:hypothetical protein